MYTMEQYLSLINSRLSELLPQSDYGEDVVCDAMKYSCENAGKRIRPVLTLEFCRICGANVQDALDFACAVEMIHTYSLIHDDLPCMDDDDMRRGKPSCHIAYGENYALLAGDALLTQAFKVVAESETAKRNPKAAVEAVKTLANLSGALGMIGGQVIDLKSEGRNIDLETLHKMDELKTSALIKCACLLGVIAANGTDSQKSAAEAFAENIGQAFQIRDDILDVIADENVLGKRTGADEKQNKSNYISLLGLEKSNEKVNELTQKAVQSLDVFEDAQFLKDLAYKLSVRIK